MIKFAPPPPPPPPPPKYLKDYNLKNVSNRNLWISLIYNSSDAQTGIFHDNWINTMDTDDLAPCIARASATMAFNMEDKWIFVFHEDIQLPMPPKY